MTETKDNREFITALARGLSVLQSFDHQRPELTLSEVATLTGLSPGTTRRCLITLQALGYVGVSGKRFFLLPKVVSIGAAYLDAARVEEVILPYLRELVATTGESSSLGVLDGEDVLHLANYSAKRLIRLTAGVGSRLPAYATSLGRVLLASLPPNELDLFLSKAKLSRLTAKTVTDPKNLRQILKKIEKEGFAKVTSELEEGLTSVAVPVRVSGRTVAALNSSTFFRNEESARATAARLSALRQAASDIARAISRVPALLHSFVPGRSY
ncbi:MAG: IclR family transcriptional regulator [Betaproteobacteria bacterium]|nr:MAG: IclR family transcriptional regulator [Betaproteobacteria bacterium]